MSRITFSMGGTSYALILTEEEMTEVLACMQNAAHHIDKAEPLDALWAMWDALAGVLGMESAPAREKL